MFQSRFGKIDHFGWWDLERILADASTPKLLKNLHMKAKPSLIVLGKVIKMRKSYNIAFCVGVIISHEEIKKD